MKLLVLLINQIVHIQSIKNMDQHICLIVNGYFLVQMKFFIKNIFQILKIYFQFYIKIIIKILRIPINFLVIMINIYCLKILQVQNMKKIHLIFLNQQQTQKKVQISCLNYSIKIIITLFIKAQKIITVNCLLLMIILIILNIILLKLMEV